MIKSQKALFLFLALLLPVIIFVFLKSFGKNEFDVTPLFQDSVESSGDCASSFRYNTPYVIPDSVISRLSWQENDSLAFVIFDDAPPQHRRVITNQIERLLTEFPGQEVSLMHHDEESGMNKRSQIEGVTFVNVDRNQYLTIRNCIFLLKPTDNSLLVDKKGRIRGHYNLANLEEADRLIMELKIILKNY